MGYLQSSYWQKKQTPENVRKINQSFRKGIKIIGEGISIIHNSVFTLKPAPLLGELQFYVSEGKGGMEETNIYLYKHTNYVDDIYTLFSLCSMVEIGSKP